MMRYCGREFDPTEIDIIRRTIATEPQMSRYRLSTTVCEQLNWRRPDGGLKDMSCRVAMLRMEADGILQLPQARRAKPSTYSEHPDIERAVAMPDAAPRVDLARLTVDLVEGKQESLLWNAYIQRHHYLGHRLLPGAQIRYFIRAEHNVVALLSFGASAWKVKVRDDDIGWNPLQRERNLHLIVNNARFLILPWIVCRNLASRSLGMVNRRLADDWERRYAYRPVLLETFVDSERFRGTCYRAANWRYLGVTKGRGKADRHHRYAEPVKSVWIYPLSVDFQRRLRS